MWWCYCLLVVCTVNNVIKVDAVESMKYYNAVMKTYQQTSDWEHSMAVKKNRIPQPIAPTLVKRGDIQPRMLAPGYYSQECNAHKACPEKKYCHLFLCVHCLKENVACTQNGQCCEGQCTYGRCKAGVSEGQPGTFCDRHEDCSGEGKLACCVREPAINPHISICKPPLAENMVCGPINFFRNVYVGAQVQKACGPCKQALICKQVGLFGIHEICMKEDDKKK